MQARVAAANRAVLAACAMILAHMVMNRGGGDAQQNRGSRHGAMAKASRQGMAWQNKAVVANSRQMKWPAQAS